MEKVQLSVSEFIALTNQTLEYAYPTVLIEGEVASFKINQSKYVFFDLKDASGSIGCFMTVWQLRVPVEDGMKVVVEASPNLTKWGKFSLTVRTIRPSGEGALKQSFELLKAKLEKEGLFSSERKRSLPRIPAHIGVISSTQAAGYADFIKILNDRWGGMRVDVAHVQVQGTDAPDQMIRAMRYFNEQEELPEVVVLIRGGGSADDLAAFNDELLVREIAASRIPILVGVGHEVDQSLADMVADVRAATPSNAAQLLVPDRKETIRAVRLQVQSILPRIERAAAEQRVVVRASLVRAADMVEERLFEARQRLVALRQVSEQLDPYVVLARGYAIVHGAQRVGSVLEIETRTHILEAEVRHVSKK